MLGDDTTTENRLRLLQAEFTQHQRRGPEPTGRTATRAEAPAPIDLGTLDYMAAAAAEMVRHTRAAAPGVDPYTGPLLGLYDWSREHTAHLTPERQQAREALIYRQGLEHAIAMGDTTVVRKHPCPACGCWGLQWGEGERKAVCTQHYCQDAGGLTHRWTLERLAREHVAAKSALTSRAT
ncbi:hypothetical protein [Streptomyces halstedii]|uniref:hypothetical protein n=1 Tax=Streptomyces halstedii TaxID=1944 RepID=UPI0038198D46